MNPTYEVGDVVQIISEEEVRSHHFEFHPYIVSPPPVSMSFDDLLKGVAQRISPPTPLAPSFKSFLP